jgi:hypothetical protein
MAYHHCLRLAYMTQGLPRVTQFLEAVLQELPDWRQSLNPFPVLSWPAFIAYLHQAVNPLAGDEHLKASLRRRHNYSFFFISSFFSLSLSFPFAELFSPIVFTFFFYNPKIRLFHVRVQTRICKRLRSPGLDSKESIPPGYIRLAESTP